KTKFMKKYISILIICMSLVSFGQNPNDDSKEVMITGNIIEASTGAPLEYATVAFTDMQGKIVTGGITDLEGKYAIKVPAGMYKVTFEFIGFSTKTLENQ